ncbi:hypothetical protein GJA_2834 [Janthinobacterium agaricidamnosum NBRC 102515 = DSM 9628]|uniref:Uncharacterized protein n=1 Tax=Janthinobacterium agaricidamnosum NBRC 102515 = DSM 9628 TaxID=1349767 RepID=W0V7B8_9BURK|nr:hypothetical protein GJA_2834 [Janthinobacterium agaricidamnosum NBRC 102515 = DSM 9628]
MARPKNPRFYRLLPAPCEQKQAIRRCDSRSGRQRMTIIVQIPRVNLIHDFLQCSLSRYVEVVSLLKVEP